MTYAILMAALMAVLAGYQIYADREAIAKATVVLLGKL
jgi:hypothetical protein